MTKPKQPKIDVDHCPAETRGYVAACRTCKWTGGGPGSICISKREQYFKQMDKKSYTKDEH